MAIKWSRVASYLENGYASTGRVDRTTVVDAAYDDAAADDIVDTLDALGSRVFNSVDDAKAFLASQGLIED
jgi:hypothetical protein